MFSSAAGWRNGECQWSIVHDSSRGIFDLESSGQPPPGFETLKELKMAKQKEEGGAEADVDYIIEIPLEVARELTGFKHDEEIDCLAEDSLQELEELKPRRRWQLW